MHHKTFQSYPIHRRSNSGTEKTLVAQVVTATAFYNQSITSSSPPLPSSAPNVITHDSFVPRQHRRHCCWNNNCIRRAGNEDLASRVLYRNWDRQTVSVTLYTFSVVVILNAATEACSRLPCVERAIWHVSMEQYWRQCVGAMMVV